MRSSREGPRCAVAARDGRPLLRVSDEAARVPGPLSRRVPARRRDPRRDDPAGGAADAAPLAIMGRGSGGGARLLSLLRPYSLLFAATIGATVVSSVLDGFTFGLLIPFQRTRAGQTIARVISDTDQVKTAVSAALASLLQNVVVIIVYVAILFGLSVKLALLSLMLAPVLLLIIRPMINRLQRRSRELAAERGEVTSHVGEMIASAKLVRAYVAEAFELGRVRELAERYRKRVLRAQRFSSLTSPLSEVVGGVMIVLILVVGTRLALGTGATLDPAVLITFLAVSLRLMSPIKSVSNYPAIMATAVASAERVFEVLDLPSAEGDRPGETTAEFSERIEFRGVSFEYEAGEAVLGELDLEVERGQVVAIVGPSGAGKTTLVDLLPRFYEPTRGDILLDGVPLTNYTRTSL